MDENDVAYICDECGEAFAPEGGDWPQLKRMHTSSHDERPTYTKTTVGKAF